LSFANPIWLWSLSGLLIPIAIHLLSRKEGKVIPVGSIRHFKESETAQFSSIRLNEILLLILRCLLIILIAMFLAGLNFYSHNSEKAKWIVIDSQIEKNIPSSTLDSLVDQGYEKHYLNENFSTDKQGATSRRNSWYLANELGNKNIDVVVFAANALKDFYGERISRPDNVQWITVDKKDTTHVIGVLTLNEDSLWVRNASSSAYLTELSTERIPNNTTASKNQYESIVKPDSITVAIYFTPEFEYDAKIIQASLLTIKAMIPLRLTILQNPPKPTQADRVFWLSKEPLRGDGKNSFSIHEFNDKNFPLLVPKYNDVQRNKNITSEWLFTKRLTEHDAIHEKLPIKLASILLPPFDEDKYSTKLPEEFTWSPSQQSGSVKQFDENRTLSVILFIAIMILATIERWIAFRRKI
jgi:hypothetical protein